MRVVLSKAAVAMVASAIAIVAAPAAANPRIAASVYTPALFEADAAGDGFVAFQGAEAPGAATARRFSLSPVAERHAVRPFGEPGAGAGSLYDAPLNEFAGQRRAFEPGLVGEALGRAKRGLFRAFAAR